MNAQASLTERVARVEAGSEVVGIAWLAGQAAFACADGAVRLADGEGEAACVAAHPDAAILVAASDGKRLLTGGDDGRVVLTEAGGAVREIADEGGRWIDAVALGTGDAAAWSAGKKVSARDGKGRVASWQAPSSARGIAFAPKGYRLAIAHYGGASLWYPGTDAPPEALDWKGSHLDITWSPDGRFVITSMQENALHGWRLSPNPGHMRMSGYGTKPRSLGWSHDGKWLATSGADAVIVWPFESKDGPMGKAPREAGVRPARVTRVACHPKSLVIATAYEDGCILLIRLTDASELLVRPARAGGAVTSLAWSPNGSRLAFGTAGGEAGILILP